jgi:hypothetical protein
MLKPNERNSCRNIVPEKVEECSNVSTPGKKKVVSVLN